VELENFPIQVKISIEESEMGASGHVKNIYFVRYFETARIQYLQAIGLNDLKLKTGIGIILAQTICNYLKPLAFPDQIIIGVKLKSIGKTSFVLEYIVVSEKNGISATGEEVVVVYDYNLLKKEEIPSIIREGI